MFGQKNNSPKFHAPFRETELQILYFNRFPMSSHQPHKATPVSRNLMPITEKLATYLRNCNEIHMYVEYVKQTLTTFRFKCILKWAEL